MADRPAILDLGDLGLERGAQVLLKRALRSLPVGGRLVIRGASRELEAHLSAWCRMQGHPTDWVHDRGEAVVVRGAAEEGRWRGAERAAQDEARHVAFGLAHSSGAFASIRRYGRGSPRSHRGPNAQRAGGSCGRSSASLNFR
jgi:hypothetical protein